MLAFLFCGGEGVEVDEMGLVLGRYEPVIEQMFHSRDWGYGNLARYGTGLHGACGVVWCYLIKGGGRYIANSWGRMGVLCIRG